MLIALPLLVIPVILYNIVVLTGGAALADERLREPLFSIGMASGSSGSKPARNGMGKHSVSGSSEFGVPSMITAKTFPSGFVARK